MNIDGLKAQLRGIERCKDFVYIKEGTIPFCDLFENINISLVEIVDTQFISGDNILGFVGSFEWKDNLITTLDGDSYESSMPVLGYKWFTSKDGRRGVEVLVPASR